MGKTEKVMSIKGCARCHGEGHENLIFEKLTYPAPRGLDTSGEELAPYTWWSPCPTNGQPILMRLEDL